MDGETMSSTSRDAKHPGSTSSSEPTSQSHNYKKISKDLEKIWLAGRRLELRKLIWDGEFTRPEIVGSKPPKISICTTVMNRKEDLMKTLLQNIKDNSDYPDPGGVEFVILDYNSNDGLEDWALKELWWQTQTGRVSYYRTEEPKKYSMTHSRNVAFKLAEGDIVLSVDADSYTEKGFVSFILRLANEAPERAFFAKSRQLLRGRIGFYKKEFIEILGGYDEELTGYGHDDMDIMNRAVESGLRMMCFRKFCRRVEGHAKHATPENYEEVWWVTEGRNRLMSYANLLAGKFKANEGRHWGKAKVTKNFGAEIIEI